MPIIVKSQNEISIMRESGRHLAEVLQMLVDATRPGMMEIELDEIVRSEYKKRDLIPTFLGYYGYPATVCISVNDKIVHGIPSKREFVEGDIVSIDLGCTHKGFVADSARTIGVGDIGPDKQKLIDVCSEALWRGIGASRGGARIGDIGHAIQTYVEGEGFAIVREYVGHGVGRAMHEDPQIPNFGTPGTGPILRPGMVIAIEPMVNVGTWQTKKESDNWTVRTKDGSLSAHFEHTLAITEGEAEVLTLP
jgi:methionyl aminopeptidase